MRRAPTKVGLVHTQVGNTLLGLLLRFRMEVRELARMVRLRREYSKCDPIGKIFCPFSTPPVPRLVFVSWVLRFLREGRARSSI